MKSLTLLDLCRVVAHRIQKPSYLTCHLRALLCSALVASGASYPQQSWADGFSGVDFLTWSSNGQTAYIDASMAMAATIAGQNGKSIGDCVGEWYYGSNALQQKRRGEILRQIGKSSEFHPTTVILAMLYKACGNF